MVEMAWRMVEMVVDGAHDQVPRRCCDDDEIWNGWFGRVEWVTLNENADGEYGSV
jgi:hypothetical protein